MKKTIYLICIWILSFHSLHANIHAEDITYEWLTTGEGCIDYVPRFKKIFSLLKVKTFLEFGVGNATKYFLDKCNKVISIEFITHGYGPETLQHYLSLYQECHNWIPIGFFSGYQGPFPSWAPYKYIASEHVYKACSFQTSTPHKNYALIDDFYRKELNSFIHTLTKCHNIDIAFVHPVLFLRSDIIESLFSKVNVIVASETHCRAMGQMHDVFGYSRLVTPSDYEEIFLKGGSGVTLWIAKKDTLQYLTEQLKQYAGEL